MKRSILVTVVIVLWTYASNAQFPAGRDLCGLDAKEMRSVRQSVRDNIVQLKKEGKLVFRKNDVETIQRTRNIEKSAIGVRFEWPLRAKNREDFRYYHIGNYTDLDTTGEACIRDWNFGYRTYDDHHGIDIGIGPYSWMRQKAGDIYAVAAAPGIIVERHDGEFDRNCDWDNITATTGRGNHVVILHADDSTVSYYMHLKNGSVANFQVGDYVETGTILGTIASSGRSTGPHLHFQVNSGWSHPDDDKGFFVEPFAGPNNYTTSVSLWKNQLPYDIPGLYTMETHTGTPDAYSSNCDSTINLNSLDNSFQPGNTVSLRSMLIDWVDGSVTHGLIGPDLTSQASWTRMSNQCSYSNPICKYKYFGEKCRVYYLENQFTLPANAQQGTWIYYTNFNDSISHHYFTVGCIQNQTFSGSQGGHRGFIVGNVITSTAVINGISSNRIEYRADNGVVLSPGFNAVAGCTFTANTQGCVRGD